MSYPPGGFSDTLARTVGAKAQAAWGQPVTVESRPGGGTVIGTVIGTGTGTNAAAKAASDGIPCSSHRSLCPGRRWFVTPG